MYDYDIIFIKGNPNSGLPQQHTQINASILELIKSYHYKIIDSHSSNKHSMDIIPNAKVYIGFSRGSRYLNKLDKSALKLSIGGIIGSNIHTFTNTQDEVLLGNVSSDSMNAHFIIEPTDKIKIKSLLYNFLKNN